MAGRKPKVGIDNKVSKKGTKEIEVLESNMPILHSQMFEAPEDLSKEELKIWNWLVNIFKDMPGCYVSDADRMTMEIYCKTKVQYDKACKALTKQPEYYTKIEVGRDKNNQPKYQIKVNENHIIKRDYAALMLKYASELGISPTGRAKQGVQATKTALQKEKEEVMGLINRPNDQ